MDPSMAQIPGFKYDIFISYTHNDNRRLTDASGWVDRFHDALESWLKYRRGFSDLTIWRDKALDGNTEFNISINQNPKIRIGLNIFIAISICDSIKTRKFDDGTIGK